MIAPQYENVIIVTRKTELDDLVARFNTKAQARFYLEQAGQSFERIEVAHEKHQKVLTKVRQAVPRGFKTQVIDREMVPRFTFGEPAETQNGKETGTDRCCFHHPTIPIST